MSHSSPTAAFRAPRLALWLAGMLLTALPGSSVVAIDQPTNAQVAKIFATHCHRCHGPKKKAAGLDLSSPQGIAQGGDTGAVLVPRRPDESLLYELVRDGEMPPEEEKRLSAAEVDAIAEWIREGGVQTTQVTHADADPILLLRCTACHGAQKQEAELDLRTVDSMLQGGKSGPAIVPGKPEESLLLRKIEAEEMPPRRRLVEASLKVIEPQEVEVLRQWIANGAARAPALAKTPSTASPGDKFWSFQRPQAAAPPAVKNTARMRTPIDAFILSQLESHELSLAPDADPVTLMRRATIDLTGLPPTPAEVGAYQQEVQRDAEQAYAQLIDRLLSSPRYGERWGRYWLDLAGYSDSEGVTHQDSVRANAWRYRDYVIRAMNTDKPYDQFLLEQIAGDELADYRYADTITPEIYDNLVATGFLRMTPDGTWANITNFVPDRLDVIGDSMEVLTSATMGLTFKCARCHSHKFDPITHRDYYALLAVFKGALDEHNWRKPHQANQFSSGPFAPRQLEFVTTAERNQWEANETRIDEAIAAINQVLELQKKELDDEQYKKFAAEQEQKKKALEGQRKPQPLIRALWDGGEPSTTYLLRRGNYLTPGKPVPPAVPAFLGGRPLDIQPVHSGSGESAVTSTGRRLAFARWLIRKDHPLTARVMVNRLWKGHFGRGLVATTDNFGKTGARPSHPELLDWLAVEFMRRNWNIKAIHRLIMTSSVYRQSSMVSPTTERRDPDNRWWSRMPLRRLDAEALRDSLLAISGQLNLNPFGPPDAVDVKPDGLVTSVRAAGWRRSVYVIQRRTQVPTLLESFDLPQMGPNCVERTESTVAPQALHLLNNPMIHELSLAMADRLIRESTTDEQALEQLYLHAAGRAATGQERLEAAKAWAGLTKVWQQHVDTDEARRKALANLCHALMNSASLLYVD